MELLDKLKIHFPNITFRGEFNEIIGSHNDRNCIFIHIDKYKEPHFAFDSDFIMNSSFIQRLSLVLKQDIKKGRK